MNQLQNNTSELMKQIKEVKPNCKDATLLEYAKKYLRFKMKFDEKKYGPDFSFLNNHKDVIEELSKYTDGTRKNYLSMLIAVCMCKNQKENEKKYRDLFNELRAKTAKPKPMPQKTIDKWITFKQVLETRKYYTNKFEALMKSKKKKKILPKKDEVDLINFVVLMLYFSDAEKLSKSMNPPRRLEYSNVVLRYQYPVGAVYPEHMSMLKDIDNDRNVLWINHKGKPVGFNFNDYKTFKHYGIHTTSINNRLKRVLNFYFKIYHNLPKDLTELNTRDIWLLPKKSCPIQPICSNQLGQIIKRTFYRYTKKKPTINTLRAIFTSEVFKNTPKTKTLKNMCRNMGNSLKIQMEYYRKNLSTNGEIKPEDIESDD
jgi:hypothetical protein